MSDSGARDDVAALEASMAGFASEESSDTNDDEEDDEEEEEEKDDEDDDEEAAREGGEAMGGGEENAEAGLEDSEAEWVEALKVRERFIFVFFLAANAANAAAADQWQ
jgi:hypothetical protein